MGVMMTYAGVVALKVMKRTGVGSHRSKGRREGDPYRWEVRVLSRESGRVEPRAGLEEEHDLRSE